MTDTLFSSLNVNIMSDSVDYPEAAKVVPQFLFPQKLLLTSKLIEQFYMAPSSTRLLNLDTVNYARRGIVMVRVVGSVFITTNGRDGSGTPGIGARMQVYGTALYPGIGIINTYNVSEYRIGTTGSTSGHVEVLWAFIDTPDAEAAVAKDTIEAYNTVDQVLTEAGLTTVAFNTELVDVTNAFAANTYTCKNAGNYRISITGSATKTAGTSNATDGFFIRILKNAAAVALSPRFQAFDTSESQIFAHGVVVPLIVGDAITIGLLPGIGGARTYTGNVRVSLAIDQS